MQREDEFIFTSESVTEGHPDKICDQISDGILDELIKEEYRQVGISLSDINNVDVPDNVKNLRCAIETFATTGTVFVAGEVRSSGYVDIQSVVRNVINDIGYNRAKYGFDGMTCGVINAIHEQSPDIAQGVDLDKSNLEVCDEYDLIGAGDQGSVFGYANNETENYMPMPIFLAHRLSERLAFVRKHQIVDYLRPDGKVQVSVKYVNNKPVAIDNIVVSTQHSDLVSQETLREGIIEGVIKPILDRYGFDLPEDHKILTNPTGRFVLGGPLADCGLTGRKIICDTYGGAAKHGGGAFSGKDPTKVDRSGAYAARYVAKNVVAADLADICEIEISYAIGIPYPVAICVDTHGTNKIDNKQIEDAIFRVFDLRPAALIDNLKLMRPIYSLTSNYGHMGRNLDEFTWEKLDKVNELKAAIGA